MENEIYISTNTGNMKIKNEVTPEELLTEANDLRKFISDIENAAEWRDLSVTEIIERVSAVVVVLADIQNKSPEEKVQEQLINNLLYLTKNSYYHEFGHLPYCDVEPDERYRLLKLNEKRLRSEKGYTTLLVRFFENIFQRLRK